jgi:hypothetical protein
MSDHHSKGSRRPLEATVLPREPFAVPAVDIDALQAEGMALLRKLCGETWTDHNVHDPGRTSLAVLCYALSDLAFRAGRELEDVIAPPPDELLPPPFFSAREVLTCAPVTATDLRKLLIDIEGVRNAWLEPGVIGEVAILVDRAGQSLVAAPAQTQTDARMLTLRGLYQVYVELDTDLVFGDLDDPSIELELELEGKLEGEHMLISPRAWARRSPHDDGSVALVEQPILADGWAQGRRAYSQLRHLAGASVTKLRVIASGDGTDLHIEIDLSEGSEADSAPGRLYLRAESVRVGHAIGALAERLEARLNADEPMRARMLERLEGRRRRRAEIMERVHTTLHANRPLCEDFPWINSRSLVEIGVCALIEVGSDVDVEQLHAEVLLGLWQQLTPPSDFRDLDELLARGLDPSEIFDGPQLRHGFAPPDLVAQPMVRPCIYASELIDVLADLDGVEAVRNLRMSSYVDGVIVHDGEAWELRLGDQELRFPRFAQRRSRIGYERKGLPQIPDSERVRMRLRQLLAAQGRSRLPPHPYDLLAPTGRWQDAGDYTSIQRHFPLTYGIGEVGLPPSSSVERHAQARQFKAYLAHFDQLMADYLGQLASVREALCVHEDRERGLSSAPSYDAPDLLWLLAAFVEGRVTSDPSQLTADEERDLRNYFDENWRAGDNDYTRALAHLIETREAGLARRIAALDHLLARHGEQLQDYDELIYALDRTVPAARIARDKAAFLRHWPETSYGRGLGMDQLRADDIEVGANRSGLELRVADMLGIPRVQRWRLSEPWLAASNSTVSVVDESRQQHIRWTYELMIPNPNGVDEPLLGLAAGTELAPALVAPVLAGRHPFHAWRELAADPDRYHLSPNGTGVTLELSDDHGKVMGAAKIEDRQRAQHVRSTIVAWLSQPPESPWIVERTFRHDPADGPPQQLWQYELLMPNADASSGTVVLASPGDGVTRDLDTPHPRHAWRAAMVSGTELSWQALAGQLDGDGKPLGQLRLADANKQDANKQELGRGTTPVLESTCAQLRAWLEGPGADAEGFHVVEHVLLRPLGPDQRCLPIALDPTCVGDDGCEPGPERYDPYSLRATIVLPSWPRRFRSREFRAHVEERLRLETPAHVGLKLCWVDPPSMDKFERAWLKFCRQRAALLEGRPNDHQQALAELIEVLANLRSVHLVSTLHDCAASKSESPVVLGRSWLGEYAAYYGEQQ